VAKTIPHRELRNNSSAILAQVKAGETFEITNHGEVVAILGPAPISEEEEMRIIPAFNPGGWADIPLEKSPLGPITQEYWDEVREDRF